MWIPLGLLAGGLALLWGGAEFTVRGASGLALRLGFSRLVVGLTVVAFGTSTPELVVSVQAAARGAADIALGNVIGSNICNVGLILGASALLRPLHPDPQLVRYDVPVLIGASLVLCVLLFDFHLAAAEGALLVVGIVAYVAILVREGRHAPETVQREFIEAVPLPHRGPWVELAQVVAGIALLALGSRLLVDGAVSLASAFGVTEAVIALSIVAFGTSLPELATSVVAALHRQDDIAIGNVVGSNIFNCFAILGVSSLVGPLVPRDLGAIDLAIMVGLSVLLLPLMASGAGLTRWKGAALVSVYACYMLGLFL